MKAIIEARTEKATLRFRAIDQGFVAEKWNRKERFWDNVATHTEYFVVMHEFFDELCRLVPKPRRDSIDSDGEKSDVNVG